MSDEELKKVANEVRKGIVTGVHAAKSGHPGGSLGAADIMTYLYFEEMNVDPADPRKADRDRFVLSKGHCAPGLYAVLAERGFFPKEDLETLRHIGSHLQGHPNMNDTPGVDMSTGSLGQGISAAVGMAVAAKHWGDTYRTYALLGDGESEEGQVWEAAMFAGNQQLDNLCVIVDHNGLQIDGPVEEVNDPMPLADKFRAFWSAVFPQVLPTYLSHCLYSFEMNVRAASILGYVGAGGLGILIDERIGWRDYNGLGTVLLTLFVAVLLIENLSQFLRSKLS